MPELDDVPDYLLLDGVEKLIAASETLRLDDGNIRLPVRHAKRLSELARDGYNR